MRLQIINLEAGMPTAAQAGQKLEQAIRTAKSRKTDVLKVIHGYGSTGKGGAIKKHVQTLLAAKKRSGAIRGYVPGERFGPFDGEARSIIDACPELVRDSDYTRGNDGITIILM